MIGCRTAAELSELSVALAQGGEAERKQLEAAELNQLLRELRDKEAQLVERHRGDGAGEDTTGGG